MKLPHSTLQKVTLISIWIITVVLLIIIVRTFLIHNAWITSRSMLPSYNIHERILTNQLAWGLNLPWQNQQVVQWSTPQRGEVVLFRNPFDQHHIWMKRVIGIAGDQVYFKNHQLYINHVLVSQTSRNNEKLPRKDGTFSTMYRVWSFYTERDWGPIQVPQGHVFLLGDNRGASQDSRTWGTISTSYLSGRPFARIWPLADMQWFSQ